MLILIQFATSSTYSIAETSSENNLKQMLAVKALTIILHKISKFSIR